ncbi:MAG: hypothetical protein ACRDH7_05070 [Actinomycetota bacterium]
MGSRWKRRRTLSERNVPPTSYFGPGMYGPGQTHRDGPLSPSTRKAWNVVIGGLVIGGLAFFAMTALFGWWR